VSELNWLRVVSGSVLVIPLVVGPVGAFGGLEGLAALFGEDRGIVVSPALRDHLRAICWMFFAIAPLVAWSLAAPVERAGTFRIVVGCAVLAGLARVVGAVVDGNPGVLAFVFAALELGMLPVILMWHWSLVRRMARAE
jgi:hypothetical protein